MIRHPSSVEEIWLRQIGELFAKARQSSGFSLKKISEATQISPSHILRMEGGDQDFTITKFCRLADALGVPCGLALESVLFYSRNFLPGAVNVHSECGELAVKFFGGPREANGAIDSLKLQKVMLLAEKMGWLVTATAEVVQAILLSANPSLLAKQLRFPNPSVQDRLKTFAGRTDPLASIVERLGTIKSLNARPYFKLRSLGILDDELIHEYIASGDYTSVYDPAFNVQKHLLAEPETTQSVSKLLGGASSKSQNDGLTSEVDSLTSDPVQPVLPKLIERLKRATQARGSKSALADWLGVHRQSVTDWLSGKQEPGGEITLRLLKWVEQRERQK